MTSRSCKRAKQAGNGEGDAGTVTVSRTGLTGALSGSFGEKSAAEVLPLAGSVRALMDQITAVGAQKRAEEAAVVEAALQQA